MKIKNLTKQLVVLQSKDGNMIPLPPRAETTIEASQMSQDIMIKKDRGVISVI